MLQGVIETAFETEILIRKISNLMQKFKRAIKEHHPKIYSQDLINALFKYPYTRIDFISKELGFTRQTASRYLHNLDKIGLLKKMIAGKIYFFINQELINVFISAKKEARDKSIE